MSNLTAKTGKESKTIRILLVEDNSRHVYLLEKALKHRQRLRANSGMRMASRPFSGRAARKSDRHGRKPQQLADLMNDWSRRRL